MNIPPIIIDAPLIVSKKKKIPKKKKEKKINILTIENGIYNLNFD